MEYQITDKEVQNFYNWSRHYWIELSRSPIGKISYALNFGLWLENTEFLYDAQWLFWEKIVTLLGELSVNHHGLEIGCGIGGFAVKLAVEKPVSLVCLDLMAEHLEIAQKYAQQQGVDKRMQFKQGLSTAIPCKDNTFDFIYCIESSFHYTNKEKFLAEVYRVLKKNGVFVFADMTCEDNRLIKFKSGNYFPSCSEIELSIEQAGFQILQEINIGHQVFQPLKEYIKRYNKGQRSKLTKYWELVLFNYTQLFKQGKMEYKLFQLKK